MGIGDSKRVLKGVWSVITCTTTKDVFFSVIFIRTEKIKKSNAGQFSASHH